MKIDSKNFRVAEEEKVNLNKWPTDVKPIYKSEKQYIKYLKDDIKELTTLQRLLYASDSYAVLLIFQGMDAAGKDGAISHVMSGVNPQGCEVFCFKQPSAEELKHDFLWRTTCRLPERGRIGIFNRSYYEEVLVVRVHPEILHSQGLPPSLVEAQDVWQERYKSIVESEKHLHRNGNSDHQILSPPFEGRTAKAPLPTASGWSNSSRVGFFLLLDQDALSRRTTPSMYGITCSSREGCTYLQQIPV